ncbi:hypothetical protein GH714_021792 [Hevea brasiliensis]|uniref:Uncharacterized protein n=1 Tax=Hevea brasiliensis TaxID=3981 RepID=A0A6A6M9E7_HEVBR|nr:hypothetical protein GH714_021792 [Hevea brasiliensis]
MKMASPCLKPHKDWEILSIISSSLQWVYDLRQQEKDGAKAKPDRNQSQRDDGESGSDDEPDWMRNFVANKDVQKQEKKVKKKFGL